MVFGFLSRKLDRQQYQEDVIQRGILPMNRVSMRDRIQQQRNQEFERELRYNQYLQQRMDSQSYIDERRKRHFSKLQ